MVDRWMIFVVLRFFLFLVFFILSISTAGFGAEVSEYKLENGLKVVIIEEHKSPVVTFQIWYRAGSKYEPFGKSGLSHLLEHMMFKGTQKYTKKSLPRLIQANGGEDNAYTTEDYTMYFQIFPPDKIALSLDIESDRMKNLTIDPKEVSLEKDVVMEERRLDIEDNPENELFEEVIAIAFKVHPYRRPEIGWMSDIRSIERDDLFKYYKSFYSPDNAYIVIAGDIQRDAVIQAIQDAFGTLSTGAPIKKQKYSEPAQQGEKRIFLKREAELPYIIISYHVPNYLEEDSYALDLLDIILSGGKSSRLYKRLVYDEKLAIDADSSYDGLHTDPYLFFIDATVSPGKDVREVERTIYGEIERLKREPPSQSELQKAKNQIESSFIFDLDSVELLAEKYGDFEMIGDWRLMDKYLEHIKKVEPDDIARVARKYLNEDNRTVGILVPTSADK